MIRSATGSCNKGRGRPGVLRPVAALGASLGALGVTAAPASAQKVVTDEDVSVGDVMLTPLADLNLSKDPIPPVLVRAYAAPYDDVGLTGCPQIKQEIGNLDAVLGEDFDTALRIKPKETPERMAQSVLAGFIPFRGVIRHFSGADRHAWEFQEAIAAGLSRRSYLKGLGQGKGCAYPARPAPADLMVRPQGADPESAGSERADISNAEPENAPANSAGQ